jgi:hypothetical protein
MAAQRRPTIVAEALWFALLLSALNGPQRAMADPLAQMALPGDAGDSARTLVKYVRPTLVSTGKAARIYYQATCVPDDSDHPVRFPKVDVQLPSDGKTALDAVRTIFRSAHGVDVTEDDTGIIRIRIGEVPDAVLRTQLSTVKLSPTVQYNAWSAVLAIENAPEVRSALEKLHILTPVRIIAMPVVEPAEGWPHLPQELSNLTLDQALDLVARTFRTLIFYGQCTAPNIYQLDTVGGASFLYTDEQALALSSLQCFVSGRDTDAAPCKLPDLSSLAGIWRGVLIAELGPPGWCKSPDGTVTGPAAKDCAADQALGWAFPRKGSASLVGGGLGVVCEPEVYPYCRRMFYVAGQ